jgi:hypothetical protein
MTITKDSTLADVYADTVADYEPTDTDRESWDTASPATGTKGAKTVVNVGLFGNDLTDFLDNCATATTNCDVEDYADYNGWAVGIEFVPSSVAAEQPAADDVSQLTFVDGKLAIRNKWHGTANVISTGTYTKDNSATVPVLADITVSTKTGYFENWSGAATTNVKAQLIFTFQDSTDEDALQVDDESDVWVYYGDAEGVKSTVTWGGAAQLTAAAGAIAIALLL